MKSDPYKKRLAHTLAEKLNLPIDTLCTTSSMELKGNRELIILECKSLLVYEDTEIHIRLCDMILKIYGRNLCLRTFCGNQIAVNGCILKIEFEV